MLRYQAAPRVIARSASTRVIDWPALVCWPAKFIPVVA